MIAGLRSLTAGARSAPRAASLAARCISGSSTTLSPEHTFEFATPAVTHHCDGPENSTVATQAELDDYLEMMLRMRRMEIAFDNEYKARNIRGFCHLYDGQEAVGLGLEKALTRDDSWITSYRCHAIALARGAAVENVAAELFGFRSGIAKGKGGSMHMYSKEENFYGGAGIVGAQVPLGVGLAFANKYNAGHEPPMNVAIAAYGDGAANQGQIWEVANMSKLWGLPMIFVIENNQYGMGTSVERHSSNPNYYTMGGNIPGIKADGMDVLAVREAARYCRQHCSEGNGPIYLELTTYRYHGHSMSDPGITYRDREEVANTRSTRDPIENVKRMILEAGFRTEEEIKAVEKSVRKEVTAAIKAAKACSLPDEQELYTEIYSDGAGGSEYPAFTRAVEHNMSIGSDGQVIQA